MHMMQKVAFRSSCQLHQDPTVYNTYKWTFLARKPRIVSSHPVLFSLNEELIS